MRDGTFMSTLAILKTAPLNKIRNNQAGDWTIGKHINAISAKMSSPESELGVSIHELIEAWRCRQLGVTDQQVTEFDAMFEKEREEGKHGQFDEAGDDPRAPYFHAHQGATSVEREVCKALGLPWEQHEANVNSLFE